MVCGCGNGSIAMLQFVESCFLLWLLRQWWVLLEVYKQVPVVKWSCKCGGEGFNGWGKPVWSVNEVNSRLRDTVS